MKKRLLSAILVLAMVLSLVPATVFATTGESVTDTKETIKYVSLGDSMTNGYGFTGYNQDTHTVPSGEHVDPSKYNYFDGTGVYGEGSYANQFAKYLADEGYDVTHTKLATSAFRAEDLVVLLGLVNHLGETILPLKDGYFNNFWSYIWNECDESHRTGNNPHTEHYADGALVPFDPGTSCGFTGYCSWFLDDCVDANGNFVYAHAQGYEDQFQYLSNHFQTSLKEADIISLHLGNASFDAYFMDRLFKIWGALGDSFANYQHLITLDEIKDQLCDKDPTKMAFVDKLYAAMTEVAAGMLDADDYSAMEMDDVCLLMTYIIFSYMYRYEQVIEWIGKENPDAKIMIAGILNSYYGLSMSGVGDEPMDMGESMGALYDMMNTYVAGMCTNYMANNEDFAGEIIFIEQPEAPEMIAKVIPELAASGWGTLDNGRLDGEIIRYKTVEAYNEYLYPGFKAAGLAGSAQTYPLNDVNTGILQTIEQALAQNPDMTLQQLMDAASWKRNWITGSLAYLGCERVMVESLSESTIELEAIIEFSDNDTMVSMLSGAPQPMDTSAKMADIIDDFADFYRENMMGVIRFFAFNKMGNGIAAHPTPSNHDRLAKNVIAAYENGYTVQDKCEDDPEMIMVNKAYYALAQKGLMTDEQTDAFIDYIVDGMINEENPDKTPAGDFVYDLLLNNKEASDNVEVIATIYPILKEAGYLKDNKDLALIEKIEPVLAPYLSPEQNMEVVDYIYKNKDNMDTIALMNFMIEVLGESNMTDAEKVSVIGQVYTILKDAGYLADYAELTMVEELYAILAPHMDDAQAVKIAKHAYAAIADDKALDDEEKLAAADFIIEVLGEKEMTAEAKASVIGKVYGLLKDKGYLEGYGELTIVEEIYAILAPHMDDAQAVKIAKFVYGVIVDDKALDEEEKEATADFIIEVLGENENLTDAARTEMIGKVYSLLKAKGYMDDNASDLAMIEDVNAYLQANDLITDAQGVEIVEYMYNAIIKGDGLDGMEFLKFSYDVLVEESELYDGGKVMVIGKLYAAVKENGYLAAYEDKLPVVEKIYEFLDSKGYIDDAQSYAIAAKIFDAIRDEELTDDETLDLAKFIYNTLIKGETAARSSSSSSNSGMGMGTAQRAPLEPADKVAIIFGVYDILKADGYMDAYKEDLQAVEDLYNDLDNAELITDEQTLEIFDILFNTLVASGELTDEQSQALAQDIYDVLITNSDLSASGKAAVLEKIYGIMRDNGLLGEDAAIAIPALPSIEKIYDFMAANGYINDDQKMQIVDYVYKLLNDDGELSSEDTVKIAKFAFAVLNNNEELEFTDKLAIVQFIYNTLAEDGVITPITEKTVYDYLVDKGLEDAVNELKAEIEARAKVYAEETNPMLKAAVDELDAEIAELNEELMALKAELEKKLAELEVAVNSADEAVLATVDQLKATIAELEAAIEAVEENIESLKAVVAELKIAIDNIEAELVALNDAVVAMDEAVRNIGKVAKETVDVAVNGAMTAVESAIEIAEEAVDLALVVYERGEELIAQTVEVALMAYDKALAIGKEILVDAIVAYYSLPEAVRAEIKATLSAETQKAITELEAQHELIQADIMAQYNEYAPKVQAEIERLNAELEEAHDEYVPVILAEIDRLNAELKAKHDEIVEAVIAQYLAQLEIVENLIEGKINEAIKELEELQAQIKKQLEIAKEEFEKAYIDATTDVYVPKADSLYVAIGDASAYDESYVDVVAERLEVEFENLAEKRGTVASAFKVVEENADTIAAADLITVGFNTNSFMNDAINQIVDEVELDWNALIGDLAAGYVTDAVDLIAEELEGQMDAATAEMLCAAVEAYAYSCVSYTVKLPELMDEIRAINPTACVVLVGMYNPLENQVIEYNGTKLEIGEYIDYLTKAAGVYNLAYAMLTANGIFVAAPEVETVFEAENGEASMGIEALVMEYVRNWGENFLPSEAGHEYIADQIINAIFKKAIWGDADGNGIVNAKDAMLVLQYYVKKIDATKLNTAVCDVDGNNAINAKDAMLILQKYVKKIDLFPVEAA